MNTYYLVPATDYEATFPKLPKDFDAITSGVVNNPRLDEFAKAAALRDSLNTFLNVSRQNKNPPVMQAVAVAPTPQPIPLPPPPTPLPSASPSQVVPPEPPISPLPPLVQPDVTDDEGDDFIPKRKTIVSRSGVKAKITPIKQDIKHLPSGPPLSKKKNAADLNVDNIISSAEKRNRRKDVKSQGGGWITKF